MRTIRVKDASILAKISGREIDFEVRDNKNTKGFALYVDGRKWLDCDVGDAGITDSPPPDHPSDQALFKIKDIISNGVL